MFAEPSACFCVWHPSRPFRPSVTSFTQISSTVRPIQDVSLQGDSLLSDVTLMGGNESGIFVSFVQPGSSTERAGLKEGHHLLMVSSSEECSWQDGKRRVKYPAMCVMHGSGFSLKAFHCLVQGREHASISVRIV